MIDGICIGEGTIYPLLFKASHIMEQSGQPRNIHLFLRKLQRSCDLLAQSADPVGVFYFQTDHVPAAIITVRVFLKCCQCFFSVNFHRLSPLILFFLCHLYIDQLIYRCTDHGHDH